MMLWKQWRQLSLVKHSVMSTSLSKVMFTNIIIFLPQNMHVNYISLPRQQAAVMIVSDQREAL